MNLALLWVQPQIKADSWSARMFCNRFVANITVKYYVVASMSPRLNLSFMSLCKLNSTQSVIFVEFHATEISIGSCGVDMVAVDALRVHAKNNTD